MMSRNASTPSPGQGPRRPAWSAHLRQFSRHSVERPLEQQPPPSPDTVSSSSTIRDMPPSRPAKPTRRDRRCTVTINDSLAKDEVLLNLELVGGDFKPDSLVAIEVVRPETDKAPLTALGKQLHLDRGKDASSAAGNSKSGETSLPYICVVKDMSKEQKIRFPGVEVYVAKHIADAFGMKKGTQVHLTPVCRA